MTSRPFGLRDEPFAEGHDRRLVYPHRTHRESVDRLALGVAERAPILLLTGAAGAGKTTTLATLLASAGDITRIDLVGSASLGVEEVWRRLAESIEAPNVARSGEALAARLAARDAGAPALVLAIDDAHELSDALLEELRVLSTVETGGRAAFTLVLAGRPPLEKRIEKPEHEGLRNRIVARGRLEAMTPRETESFLHHRVSVCGGPGSVFPRPTCRAIHEHARGIARDVRVLAGEALTLAGAAGAQAVETAHVNAAIEKLGHSSARSAKERVAEPKVAKPQPVEAAGTKDKAPEPVEAKVEASKPAEAKVETPKIEPKVEATEPIEQKAAPERATAEKAEKPQAAPAKSTAAPTPDPPAPKLAPAPAAAKTPKPASSPAAAKAPAPASKPAPAPKRVPAPAAEKAPATPPAKASAPVAAKSEAPAPASKLAPGPSAPAPKATPEPLPVLTPEEATYVSPPVEHTPAIDAWLARFHDPAGAPRIGSRVAVDDSTTELAHPRLIESPVEGAEGEALPPLPKLRPRRGRVVGRGPLRPSRYARRSSSIGWVAAATVIAAIGAILWLHRADILARLSSLAKAGKHTHASVVAAPAPAPTETREIAHETPEPAPEPAPPPRSMTRTAVKTSRVTVTPLKPGHSPAPPHAPASPDLYEPATPESTPKETTTSDTTPQGATAVGTQTERHYRVIVGTYLVPDRAQEERDRVASLTPFPCKVLRGHEDGGEVFRVLVGPFATRDQAEAASEQLSSTGSVNEARVVGWFGPKAPHD